MKIDDHGLEESLALAKALEEEEDRQNQKELEEIHNEMNAEELRNEAEGDSISSHVN
jgi:hypothetical protein